MAADTLTCELETVDIGSEGVEIGLAFTLLNTSDHPVTIRHFYPFLEFELRVRAGDEEIPLVQPGYDTGVQPVSLTIPPGDTARLETPITLRFDPAVPISGGDVPTRWSLERAPTAVTLEASLQIAGVDVPPCVATWTP